MWIIWFNIKLNRTHSNNIDNYISILILIILGIKNLCTNGARLTQSNLDSPWTQISWVVPFNTFWGVPIIILCWTIAQVPESSHQFLIVWDKILGLHRNHYEWSSSSYLGCEHFNSARTGIQISLWSTWSRVTRIHTKLHQPTLIWNNIFKQI